MNLCSTAAAKPQRRVELLEIRSDRAASTSGLAPSKGAGREGAYSAIRYGPAWLVCFERLRRDDGKGNELRRPAVLGGRFAPFGGR